MSTQFTVLLVVQIITSFTIIVLVLLQQGKGADMGSAFGSGSAGSLFGSTGAANFLSRATKWAAVVFFGATMGLAYLGNLGNVSTPGTGIMEGFETSTTAPAVPADRSVPSVPQSGEVAVPVENAIPAVPAAKE